MTTSKLLGRHEHHLLQPLGGEHTPLVGVEVAEELEVEGRAELAVESI